MRSPKPLSLIIACPHCGTRYQVPPETLGDAGRKVACAHCGKSWLAEPGAALPPPPEDDRLFSEADEAALDRNFASEEATLKGVPASVRQLIPKGEVPPPEVMRSIAEIKAALEVKAEPGATDKPREPESPPTKEQKKAQGKLEKRQQAFASSLPAARFSRVLRGVGVGLLIGVLGGAVLFRTEVVRVLPDLAGIYAAIGLKVNVVGLDFSDVTTLLSRRGTSDVITVNATIYGVEPRRLLVPPVVVTLLGEDNLPVYAWSVAPKVRDLEPGETIGFDTELMAPPTEAKHVRLSFADSTRALAPIVAADAAAPTPGETNNSAGDEPAPADIAQTHVEEGSH